MTSSLTKPLQASPPLWSWLPKLHFVGYLLGSATIALAVMAYLTSWPLTDIFAWLEKVFTGGFLVLYLVLCSVAVYAGTHLVQKDNRHFWYEAGMQASGGIATLALTFTLLGISLGIGSLSEQEISPETIQGIIKDLTRHFSTAFLTTVVGLPTATLLRAFVSLRYARFVRTDEQRDEQIALTEDSVAEDSKEGK